MASLETSRTDSLRVREPSLEVRSETVVGKPISGPQTSRVASSTPTTAAAPATHR